MLVPPLDLTKPCELTLDGAPAGHDARAMAELASRAESRTLVYVAPDEAAAARMAEMLAFFAPHVEVLPFPAWDCLPYDRVGPQPDIMGQRLATLDRLAGMGRRSGHRILDTQTPHPNPPPQGGRESRCTFGSDGSRVPDSCHLPNPREGESHHVPSLPQGERGPCVLVTTPEALAQRTLPPAHVREGSLTLAVGSEIPMDRLCRFLAAHGYVNTSTVREPGEFARRGGLVDLFPPAAESPVRVDFLGETVDALRAFDPLTQMTRGVCESLVLRAASEIQLNERTLAAFRSGYRALFGTVATHDPLYEAISEGRPFPGYEHWLPLFVPHLAGLLDYVPNAPVAWGPGARESLATFTARVQAFYEARRGLAQAARANGGTSTNTAAPYRPLPPEQLYQTPEDIRGLLQHRAVLHLESWDAPEGPDAPPARAGTAHAGGHAGPSFAAARIRSGQDVYAALKEAVAKHLSEGRHVVLACASRGSAERLGGLLNAQGIATIPAKATWDDTRRLDPGLVALAVLGLDHGFISRDVAVITEQDILGERLARPARASRGGVTPFQMELSTLVPGDLVTHNEHGIGRYEGLETLTVLGAAHDCVKLIYDGGDKLYVPVESLEVLTRYGSGANGGTLDKLGGAAWQNRKARLKGRLKDLANELMSLAATRRLKPGLTLAPPEDAYEAFAAKFPWAETEDQTRAIQETLEDLARGRPMDRLVCGDVGFGKTEIALRAAFAAVASGFQVAILTPTTLLARQHTATFRQRFAGLPFRIGSLSRLVPPAEAKTVKEGAKTGTLDIVIGTHALLAKDAAFARLGLLIVDEEQHFGVKQKEKIKQLRADVHVLTLTATPIPRTLHLALSGAREISLIATPPADRLAVLTSVVPYDPIVIRDALRREHARGGQSFCVCPRIEHLEGVAEALRELVPDIKLAVAHGQMPAKDLDDLMTAFDAGAFGLLIATDIIESGLDIPNANTLIIHRADMLGLSQLYQLRGRVGRSKRRGYAYLTYPPDALLTSTARQRLEAIQTLDHLGAGFQVASYDMDIRGAGNLLGEEQSGHIREVGVELYQQLLEEALATARAGGTDDAGSESWTPQINLGLSVLIPEGYVSDLNLRLSLYRRLATGEDATESIAAEMIDRFGPMPEEVENLLQTVAVKNLCRKAGISRLDAGPQGAVIRFHNDRFDAPERLIAWITAQSGTARLRPDNRLVLARAWDAPARRLEGVRRILHELAALSETAVVPVSEKAS